MRLLALPLLLLATPALAAEQFDLACQGTRVTQPDAAPAPHAFRVRVDLTGKQWCIDACARLLAITDAGADKIVLMDDFYVNSRSEYGREATFDRKTGAFYQSFVEVRPEESYLKVRATCTSEPFSAFPAAKP